MMPSCCLRSQIAFTEYLFSVFNIYFGEQITLAKLRIEYFSKVFNDIIVGILDFLMD